MSREPMLLATFQPIEPSNRHKAFRAFQDVLGYYPIFCFAARTPEEFQFFCWTSTPRLPEKLVLFESSDYVAFDAVEWCQLYGNDGDAAENLTGADIKHIFENVEMPYAEFIVPSIPEASILDEVRLVDLIDNELPAIDDEVMSVLADSAKHNFDVLLSAQHTSRHPRDDEQRRALAHCAKTIFDTQLSGITYRAMRHEPTPLERAFPFSHAGVYEDEPDDANYLIPAIELRKKIYDTSGGGSHEEFDKMVRLMTVYQERMLEDATSRFLRAGRNDPCPCGSGKKFKKCHGSPAALSVKLYEPFHQDGLDG